MIHHHSGVFNIPLGVSMVSFDAIIYRPGYLLFLYCKANAIDPASVPAYRPVIICREVYALRRQIYVATLNFDHKKVKIVVSGSEESFDQKQE
jgi:hypothetical protein